MTSSAVVRVNWPPRFHGISRLHLSELRLWLCSSVAHPTLFSQVRGNRNSRKFKVASDPSSSAPCTRVRQGGASSESERRDLVAFVAPLCSKALRLATSQLPENSCPIGPGPGQSRTSA